MRFHKYELLIIFDSFLTENYIVFHKLEISIQYVFPPLNMCCMHNLFWLVLNEQLLQMLSQKSD